MARTWIRSLQDKIAQSIFSLLFNLGGLIAGGVLALHFNVFSMTSWTVILFPCILSVRGAIGGVFSAHLSTGLHLGTIKPDYRGSGSLYKLLASIFTLALESSLFLGSITFLIRLLFRTVSIEDYIDILSVLSGTMGFSVLLVAPITTAISFLSFRRRMDPDIIVYPITSTVADIIVTACYISILNIFFLMQYGKAIIYLVDIAFIIFTIYLFIRNVRDEEYIKILREFIITLLIIVVIVNVSGLALNGIKKLIGRRLEIYTVYPALIDTMGDFGSIVGSTATTKLFTGIIEPSYTSIRDHTVEIAGAWISSLLMFLLFAVIVNLNYHGGLDDLKDFMLNLIFTNVLAAVFMILISFGIAILTFKHALDPDNFVIPIESSISDTITTIFLFVSLIVL